MPIKITIGLGWGGGWGGWLGGVVVLGRGGKMVGGPGSQAIDHKGKFPNEKAQGTDRKRKLWNCFAWYFA